MASIPMAHKPTVKCRLLIMSDTHEGFQQSLLRTDPWAENGENSFRPPFPKADVLIHSGDLTMVGTMDQYRGALNMLKSITDVPLKLVIAGNHDLSLHSEYYLNDPNARQIAGSDYDATFAHQAETLWTSQEAKDAGIHYLTEGMYTFELGNGAKFTVYASPWQPVFFDWAFNYPSHHDRWNPEHLIKQDGFLNTPTVPAPESTNPKPIPDGAEVDIMITHGPPRGHLDKCDNGTRAGCPHLLAALDRVRPRLHCFGHIHEAWGAEVVSWRKKFESTNSDDRRNSQGEGLGGRYGELTETYGSLDDVEGRQKPTDQDALHRRANYLDFSKFSKRPLQAGLETILINSCIMDLDYEAKGSAWLLDMELPIGES